MKQKIIILMAGILMLASCSNREDVQADDVVTLRFQTWDMKIDPMTRSGLNLADFATHLDIWVVNGTDVQQVHQVSTQAGYGTVQLTLNKTKTYTLYAVAHRCTEAASLSEGIVSFPDEKVTQSFFATATLTPATATSQDVTLNRIVGWSDWKQRMPCQIMLPSSSSQCHRLTHDGMSAAAEPTRLTA